MVLLGAFCYNMGHEKPLVELEYSLEDATP